MNPLGLVSRILVVAALFVALVMSFVSSFLVVSFDAEGIEGNDLTFGVSAWHHVGLLGGLAIIGALPIAIVAAALPNRVSVARRVLAGVAAAACLGAVMAFVLYLLVEINDISDGLPEVRMQFGWSGFVTLAALAVGAVAGSLASLLTDPRSAPAVPSPPS